jgi:hypothetical protein
VPGVKPADGATLRGRWHPGRLSDIRRMPYSPPSTGTLGLATLPDTPPCPAPASGWRDVPWPSGHAPAAFDGGWMLTTALANGRVNFRQTV